MHPLLDLCSGFFFDSLTRAYRLLAERPLPAFDRRSVFTGFILALKAQPPSDRRNLGRRMFPQPNESSSFCTAPLENHDLTDLISSPGEKM
ncbi:hypothetical protein L1887_58583 [Cichorium endivia]|nr:hypothetical protein L1887_58583 [Cichorium endivia]